ncbi:MAG: DUF4150 domain-containing protein, partial [Myxococcales bacterium]|nr:DUF4150 domain-containing protein [Myxococcales bacterium]
MAKVTALKMDVVTKKSGHQMTGLAVSVCLTPAAPSPLPIPYPTMGTVAEGILDPAMRTKVSGAIVMTVGSCMSKCHGNEPGTLKEVVSLNTAGPCFPVIAAPLVICELGMMGITMAFGFMNKSITVGASGSASGAGGNASGGGGGGGGGGGPNGPGTQGPSGGGGDGGGSSDAAAPPEPPAPPAADGQATTAHPIDTVTGALIAGPIPDIQLPGPIWTRLLRCYRSSGVVEDCGLGHGWSHSFAVEATLVGERLTLIDETRRRVEIRMPDEEIVILPYGRRLWVDQGNLVLDYGDGLFRVLMETSRRKYRLVEVRDELGSAARLTWDGKDLVEIVDAVGRRVWLERHETFLSYHVMVVDAEGREHRSRLVTYEIDERGDLVRAIDAGGVEVRYAYDDRHYLVREEQADGLRYHFVYEDVAGVTRCVESWGDFENEDVLAAVGCPASNDGSRPKGLFHSRLDFSRPGETVVHDGATGKHVYEGNALGLVTRYVAPDGGVRRYRYDQSGRLLSVEDPAGRAVRLAALPDGTPSSITLGSAVERVRRQKDGGTTIIHPDGLSETTRHAAGKPTEHVDETGRRTRWTYDARGLLESVEHPNGTKETRSYDAHGNLEAVEGPTGARYAFEFDLLGCPVKVTTPDGLVLELQYDSRNLLARIDSSAGLITQTEVDAMRRVVARQLGADTTTFHYVAGALVEKVEPDGSHYRFGYDSNLRLRWIENPAGETYQCSYDAAGRLEGERFFSGQSKQYHYDASGLLGRVTHGDGTVLELERDQGGRVVTRRLPDGSDRLAYDADGRLLRAENAETEVVFDYDERGRPVGETQTVGAWRFEVRHELDDNGLVTARHYSTGWGYAVERRDEDGAPTRLSITASAPSDADCSLGFDHDVMSRESRRWFESSGVALITERDLHGLPAAIAIEPGDRATDRSVRTRRYTWSPRGPLAAIDDDHAGRRDYELDARGRVTSATGLGARERFHYAPQGTPLPAEGRWNLATGGRPTVAGDAHLDWDARGRLVACTRSDPRRSFTYRYDADNRLREATRGDGVSFRYVYDALGRRLAALSSTGTSTFFGWDGNALVEEDVTDGEAVRRIYDDFNVTPIAERRGGRWHLVATDAASTPWAYVDDQGAAADVDLGSWGKVARSSGDAGSLRFAGQRYDATTGLHYNRHRYYDPELHVFLTPDPLGVAASLQDIGFVPNVTYFIDPLGLTTIVAGSRTDPAIQSHVKILQEQNPGARVIYSDQLGRPPSLWQRIRGRNNRLDDE